MFVFVWFCRDHPTRTLSKRRMNWREWQNPIVNFYLHYIIKLIIKSVLTQEMFFILLLKLYSLKMNETLCYSLRNCKRFSKIFCFKVLIVQFNRTLETKIIVLIEVYMYIFLYNLNTFQVNKMILYTMKIAINNFCLMSGCEKL